MAPKPLRGARPFLIVALLAASLAARATTVSVPETVNTGNSGSGSAGSINTGPGAGGVNAIPQMSLTLTPGLSPGVAPGLVPLAAPIPAAQFNPPAGFVGHNPALPVSDLAAFAKPVIPRGYPEQLAAELAAEKARRAAQRPVTIDDLLKSPPKPPAIDSPNQSAAAGELDAKLLKIMGAAKAPASNKSAEMIQQELRLFYDGMAVTDGDDGSLDAEFDRAPTGTFAKAGKGSLSLARPDKNLKGASKGPVAPTPPGAALHLAKTKGLGVAAVAQIKAWYSGLGIWIKDNFAGTQADVPTINVMPAVTAEIVAESGKPMGLPVKETVVVRSSRGGAYEANGYKVLYAKPVGEGVKTKDVKDDELSVKLERSVDGGETQALREHFARFNVLIETNFAALELIAQSSSKMTIKTARAIHVHVDAMARAYSELVAGDRERADEAMGIQMEVRRLIEEIEKAVQGLPDGDLLPPKAVALVMPIDKRALHYYVNQLHQKALDALGRSNEGSRANLTVRMGEGSEKRSVSLVDLSERPIVAGGRAVAPGFKALLAAMSRSKDTPKGSLIMQDHQFWGHFKLGAHSAEIYASFLPPDEGGMIRIRYQEWGTGYDNQTRLYYVGRLLHKAGFHVDTKNGFLTAVVDKDHAAQTADEMTETFALVVQALHATVGIDFALPLLVRGAKSSEEVGARIDAWVETVIGEGTLPFYVNDEQQQMVDGWGAYQKDRLKRATLRAALDNHLKALGLPPIPAEEHLGQRTIDRYVNDAIEKAIARGQLRLGADGRLGRNASHDPLATLAKVFAGETLSGARMAEVVSSLDPALFRYETIGSLGQLTVERAQRRLDPGAWVTVYVLRDQKTGQIGLARAEISSLKPGEKPSTLSPAGLFAELKAQGHPIAEFTPSELPPGAAHFARLLKNDKSVRGGFGRRHQGLAASPGDGRTFVAKITYDKAKAALGGYVFVAAYTTPDDLDAIKGSKAVITTSGGLLSHAAITTREMGIPATILPRVEWANGSAVLPAVGLGKPRDVSGLAAREARSEGGVVLAEGDVVRVDPATGVVETFPRGVNAALLDAANALAKWDATGDTEGLAKWLDHRVRTNALQHEQKLLIVSEAIAGLFGRADGSEKAKGLLTRVLSVLPGTDHVLGYAAAERVAALIGQEIEDAQAAIKERRELVRESMSSESLERFVAEGHAAMRRLRALSGELKRPKTELVGVEVAFARFLTEAGERNETLVAEEIAELHEHARVFPAATAEALPLIKSAIAKARRRGLDSKLIESWRARAYNLEKSRKEAMEKRAPAALPLSAILDVDVAWVGGKAAKLGEIAAVVRAAGGEVPPGIALTVNAYRRFLKESGISVQLEALGANKHMSPEERSRRARSLILGGSLRADAGVGKEIVAALMAQGLGKTMLAVRSSAVDEDGAEAAFAGAGDTHLYVSPEEMLEHVKDVWASLWNPRALLYRQTKGLSTENLAQAVVVQAMAHSEVSGVAFTQDPVTGSSGRVIVNSAFGLGEGIVSGRVAPDQYTLAKQDGREILPAMISDKKMAIVRGKEGKGTIEHKMPAEWRRRRSLTPAKLQKLNDVSVALERHFGYALDIEFGFVGDTLYILQARPVTVAGEKKAPVPAPPTGSQVKPAQAQTKNRLMFVCTGNTCRSPMAAYMMREKLARKGRGDIEVVSRGLKADVGAPMSTYAQSALDGQDASGHRAAQITVDEVMGATIIVTMTAAQKENIQRVVPAAAKKVYTLAEIARSGSGGDVADPYGKDENAYRNAALEIEGYLDAMLARIPDGDKEPAPAGR